MNKIIYFFFLTLISCSYPDIDSVPKNNNLIITEEDAIELCKLSSSDNVELIKCLVSYYETKN